VESLRARGYQRLRDLGFLANTRNSKDDGDEEDDASAVTTTNRLRGIAPPIRSKIGVKAS
jgi:hypothetical protein